MDNILGYLTTMKIDFSPVVESVGSTQISSCKDRIQN
jgi:hypothetical protein